MAGGRGEAASCRLTVDQVVSSLPAACAARVVGDGHVVPVGITHDSRSVQPSMAFACVRGEHHDGHDYAPVAVAAGASVLVVDHELATAELTTQGASTVTQIVVDDVRLCLGWIASELAGNPSSDLLTVGVTGTNGKTTTVALLASIFEAADLPAGVIGTLSGSHTTPEAPDLQRSLTTFRSDGKRVAVMEVSSHALALHRVTGTRFAAAVFTNLGEDHLDLHGSVDAYFRAKATLFTRELSNVGIVNVDDPRGRLLVDTAGIDMIPFSVTDATDVDVTPSSIELTWRSQRVHVPIGGHFNVANVLAAATAAEALGVDRRAIAAGLAAVAPIPGRFEHVVGPPGSERIDVVVDYAHTPDGLTSVLTSARQLVEPPHRVLAVFGCGGDRDHEKRPRMGAAAARHADMTVVTSDNPRSERPEDIIDAIVSGVNSGKRERILIQPDRRAAIQLAIDRAEPGDLVVIAGKGHETTQTTGTVSAPFDDRIVAAEALAARAGDRS